MNTQVKRRVTLVRDSFEGKTWAELRTFAEGKTKWSASSKVYYYLESLKACHLTEVSWGEIKEDPDAKLGRWFDSSHEVRWHRAAGGYQACHIADKQDDGGLFMSALRDYYLIGTWNEGRKCFAEGRYPNATFHYPESTRKGDRASIQVLEYERVCQDWSGLNGQAIEAALNEPMLVEHRFTVNLGRGGTNA